MIEVLATEQLTPFHPRRHGAAMIHDDPINTDGSLNGEMRAAQKQASRGRDATTLKSGEMPMAKLTAKNDMFDDIDLSRVRIAAIGDKPYVIRRE